jgi:hypothetical protein
MKPSLLAVLLLFPTVCGHAQPRQRTILSVCVLLDSWKNYHGHEVTFHADYSEEKVQEKLQDRNCPELLVAVEWPPRIPSEMKTALSKLDSLVARDSHKKAQVVIRGVFYGPVPYRERDIPSNLSPKMKEQMRKGHQGYGYMSAYNYLLKVTEIAEAEPVSEHTEKSPSR